MNTSSLGEIMSRLKREAVQPIRKSIQKMQGKQIVHLLHVGKTGGTAVHHALQKNRITNSHALYLHPHDFKLRDVPNGESVAFFLRDPISRFVSGFYSRQRQGQPRFFMPWNSEEKRAFEYFRTPNDLAISLSSFDYVKKGRAQTAMKCIYHVRNTYWEWFESEAYFKSRLSDVFFVGFQESLAEDFQNLAAKLGLPDGVKLPEDDILAHRNAQHKDRALEDAAIENLRQWYKEDYLFFELCRDMVPVSLLQELPISAIALRETTATTVA